MAYDNWDVDLNLAAHKYCGDYGSFPHGKGVENMKAIIIPISIIRSLGEN